MADGIRGFLGRDIISSSDFNWEEIMALMDTARYVDAEYAKRLSGAPCDPRLFKLLSDKYVTMAFFEDSTRTRNSHQIAAELLGATVNGFGGVAGTSADKKQESIIDTIKTYAGYGSRAIVVRHTLEGTARFVADALDQFALTHGDVYKRGIVINGGDGKHEHPTQMLLDMYTILSRFPDLNGREFILSGDLKYGRTVHSLLYALSLCAAFTKAKIKVNLVSPSILKMPETYKDFARNSGIEIQEMDKYDENVIRRTDVWYTTRIQKERMGSEEEFERVAKQLVVTKSLLDLLPDKSVLVHPMPVYKRVPEVTNLAQLHPKSWMYRQSRNGLIVRIALFAECLGGFNLEKFGKYNPCDTHSRNVRLHDLPLGDPHPGRDGRYTNDIRTDGTVIDHLKRGQSMQLHQMLDIPFLPGITVFPCQGVMSRKTGQTKDVYKVEGYCLTEEELAVVGVIAPYATITEIKGGQKVRKYSVEVPGRLEDLIRCPNPTCISREEHCEGASSIFFVDETLSTLGQLVLRCHYDDTRVYGRDIELLK